MYKLPILALELWKLLRLVLRSHNKYKSNKLPLTVLLNQYAVFGNLPSKLTLIV